MLNDVFLKELCSIFETAYIDVGVKITKLKLVIFHLT